MGKLTYILSDNRESDLILEPSFHRLGYALIVSQHFWFLQHISQPRHVFSLVSIQLFV